ncbi:MAG: hypothetical protein WCX28_14340 [Bacteriovoracaceae bacterium]|nr:hypothetical protein [Bacteroidota bacterium]
MPPPTNNKPTHNEEMRKYVLRRDNMCCQWPGCGSTLNIDVLFLIETENGSSTKDSLFYKNGVTLCPKHMEIVNLHDKAFGPLIFDLIQLVEFERDLQETEKVYKELLSK